MKLLENTCKEGSETLRSLCIPARMDDIVYQLSSFHGIIGQGLRQGYPLIKGTNPSSMLSRVLLLKQCSNAGRWLCTSTTTSELPWSIIKPYGSIRVDLTEAFSSGWYPSEEFLHQLQSVSSKGIAVIFIDFVV